jgi:hypothetical protein
VLLSKMSSADEPVHYCSKLLGLLGLADYPLCIFLKTRSDAGFEVEFHDQVAAKWIVIRGDRYTLWVAHPLQAYR